MRDPRKPLESDNVRQIMDGLGAYGFPCWVVRERLPGSQLSTAGIPDICGVVPTRRHKIAQYPVPFFLEVKRTGKSRRRQAQIAFIRQRQLEGCIADFVVDFDDVMRLFKSNSVFFGVEVLR